MAPVLIVPDVLEPALCACLIQAHAADHAPSGMLRLRDGQPVLEPDARVKQRFDHRLTEPALVAAVTTALARRVLPEIAAAFQYEVSQLEGFKVTAYDAAHGGWFRPHRDNMTPDARHRRFALTIALDDDFDGGGLRFPGFGPTLYRPRPGGAIVFSGALLHEVTDVTRGRRHVLLSFLWGDEVQHRPGGEGR
jgi:predicted 2-oxoglutarate/Fe(II)-dependent dioxygenase YbiX